MEAPSSLRLRSIALPTEHGGWGFTIEPILLGMLVAFSAAAVWLGAAALAVFLSRRPLKLVMTDLRLHRRLPRTNLASVVLLAYLALAGASLGAAVWVAAAPFGWPLLAAIPWAAVSLVADAGRRSRDLFPELSGVIAMGATAPMIALADGRPGRLALGLWLVLAARDVASIVLVRAQIRRARGKPIPSRPVLLTQAAVIVVMATLAATGTVPWSGAAAIAGLGAWAIVALAARPVPAKIVGATQSVLGVAVVFITAAGY